MTSLNRASTWPPLAFFARRRGVFFHRLVSRIAATVGLRALRRPEAAGASERLLRESLAAPAQSLHTRAAPLVRTAFRLRSLPTPPLRPQQRKTLLKPPRRIQTKPSGGCHESWRNDSPPSVSFIIGAIGDDSGFFPLGLAADGLRAAECFKKVTIRRLPRVVR